MKRRPVNNSAASAVARSDGAQGAEFSKPGSKDTGKDDQVILGGNFAQALRFLFIPHKVNKDEPKLDSVRRLCSIGTSFEELIVSWVEPQIPSRAATTSRQIPTEEIEQPGYSITISRNDEMPYRSIGVIFERGDQCFGIACVAVDQSVSMYGAHERLNESTFSLSDSDGFTCDQEWFDKRNHRLGIVEDPQRGGHIVPPASIGELVLEYSLSTAGFVRFAAAERTEDPGPEIELTLVFLGKDLTRGWHEEMTVDLGALRQYVQGSRNSETPTLLI